MPQVNPDNYDRQLADKCERIRTLFSDHDLPDIEVFPSPPRHFRMRAEFRIWHEGEQSFYAMTPPGERKPQPIDGFDIGSEIMVATMPPLLEAINNDQILRRKLYAVEFLTTLSGEVLVTMIYHRPLDDQWQQTAEKLSQALNIGIIGRSKKQKLALDKDFVTERLEVDGETYSYQQVETGFTQPNARVNEKMLGWAKAVSAAIGGDLLELYCGNGNFTVVLSENFDKVLATELSKVSVRSAEYNFDLNGVTNVAIGRMSSEEFTDALNGVRAFNRLRHVDLDDYNFTTLFVDPPRAGLDDGTLALAAGFEHILYISCNPETLNANMDYLATSHRPLRFALFDQFPYTHHIECGVLLQRR